MEPVNIVTIKDVNRYCKRCRMVMASIEVSIFANYHVSDLPLQKGFQTEPRDLTLVYTVVISLLWGF